MRGRIVLAVIIGIMFTASGPLLTWLLISVHKLSPDNPVAGFLIGEAGVTIGLIVATLVIIGGLGR